MARKQNQASREQAPFNRVVCPECGEHVDDRAPACPVCGTKIYVELPADITPVRNDPEAKIPDSQDKL